MSCSHANEGLVAFRVTVMASPPLTMMAQIG
uniref:Uncharacterized protein n=1 Tax=Arundo donax TaxID=35708 RepID=A0A0A9BYH5_ARUDO